MVINLGSPVEDLEIDANLPHFMFNRREESIIWQCYTQRKIIKRNNFFTLISFEDTCKNIAYSENILKNIFDLIGTFIDERRERNG